MIVTDCWQMSQASTFGRHAAYVCHEDVPAIHIQHLHFRQLLQARAIVHIAPVNSTPSAVGSGALQVLTCQPA